MLAAIHHWPTWLLGVAVVSAFAFVAVAGFLLFRRVTGGRLPLSEDMNNDIIFFSSAIGVFYSLVVGLMAASVWSNYSGVGDVLAGEAAALGALHRIAKDFPEPTRGQLQADVRDYMAFVIDRSWPAQRRGELTDEAGHLVDRIQEHLLAFEPATLGEQAVFAETLRLFTETVELRRRRIGAIGGNLPGVMWGIVLVGAALSVGVTYLLKIQTVIQVLLTGFLAAFIGLVVFVMAGMDSPLTGPLALSSGPYEIVLDRMAPPR
jgi:amino acid transporter